MIVLDVDVFITYVTNISIAYNASIHYPNLPVTSSWLTALPKKRANCHMVTYSLLLITSMPVCRGLLVWYETYFT